MTVAGGPSPAAGPLAGTRVLDLTAIGPGPFAAMMLADMGAGVVRIDRPAPADPKAHLYIPHRNRRSAVIDIRRPAGADLVLRLVETADVLLEGNRPGVMERLGLGPAECLARNPRLVYGRMTGWGQDGPLAGTAGHDIDYLALTGALAGFARYGEPPVPPMNLVADFGGGGMMLAFGVVCGLVEARSSGAGQVVDAAMVDGVATLLGMVLALRAQGRWSDEPGTNVLDTGAPFYDVYRTSDGRYLAVGALEPPFYARFVEGLGLDPAALPAQFDRRGWPVLRAEFTRTIAARRLDEWTAEFATRDACVAPVLSLDEAIAHPHHRHRGTFVEVAGLVQPAPAPRLGRTPGALRRSPVPPGTDTDEILAEIGVGRDAVRRLRADGVVSGPVPG